MKKNFFIFNNIQVFFKHTDYYGFVHPYVYFEWTSYVREAFFQETVPNFLEVLNRPIKMMTVKIACENSDDLIFGDKVEARLTVAKQKKVSFDMIVRFHSAFKQKVVCETTHTIVFVDSINGKFAPIPTELYNVIVNYQEESSEDSKPNDVA